MGKLVKSTESCPPLRDSDLLVLSKLDKPCLDLQGTSRKSAFYEKVNNVGIEAGKRVCVCVCACIYILHIRGKIWQT